VKGDTRLRAMSAEYVNHISYEVNDYKKVRDFYVDLLGMKVTEDDGKQCRLVFGNNMLIPRNRAGGGPCGILRLKSADRPERRNQQPQKEEK
jgi:catechol 2,3-dioxygenase-like lactoylglutathione lyase family enzyme